MVPQDWLLVALMSNYAECDKRLLSALLSMQAQQWRTFPHRILDLPVQYQYSASAYDPPCTFLVVALHLSDSLTGPEAPFWHLSNPSPEGLLRRGRLAFIDKMCNQAAATLEKLCCRRTWEGG